MQDVVRQTLPEAQASFEALAFGRQETEKGKQDVPEARGSKGDRWGQGATPGGDAAAGEPGQGLQAEGRPLWRWMGRLNTGRGQCRGRGVGGSHCWVYSPGRLHPADIGDRPDFNNNIVGFDWVADKTASREWMSKLHWQAPAYMIGWEEMYNWVQTKIGVFTNLRQSVGLTAKEGFMLLEDGMKSVCETAQTNGLELKATLKAMSEVRNNYEPSAGPSRSSR